MVAGQEVLAYCGSCKLDLAHIIVAHKTGDSGPVAKCECKTCRKIHSYRIPKGPEGVAKERKKRSKRATVETVPCSVEWREQLSNTESPSQQSYSIKASFNTGDVLDHHTFGVGIVQKSMDSTKIEVLFEHSVSYPGS